MYIRARKQAEPQRAYPAAPGARPLGIPKHPSETPGTLAASYAFEA